MNLIKTYFIKTLKFAKGLADLLIALFVYVPVHIFYMLPAAAAYRRRARTPGRGRCIIYLIPGGGIQNVLKKHKDPWQYKEKDLDGYFERVIIHNFAAPTGGSGSFYDGRIVAYDQVRYLRTLAWLTTAVYTIRTFRLVLQHEPDILRAQDGYQVSLALILVARLTRTPYCISLHADNDLLERNSGNTVGPYYLGSRMLAKAGEKWCLGHTPFVLPISKYVGRYAVKSGARPEAVRVIYHGREPDAFDVEPDDDTRRRFIRDGDVNIVVVSRLHREKRVMDAVDIGRELAAMGMPFHIVMCGDGPHRTELESLIRNAGLEAQFTLPGFLSSEDIVKVTKAADVNLCLYGGWALIEAALSGKPIVAYDIEWHSELVRPGETGLLAPDGDAAAVARAIARLRDEPDIAAHMGRNAHDLAMARHITPVTQKTKQQIMDEILEFFKEPGAWSGRFPQPAQLEQTRLE